MLQLPLFALSRPAARPARHAAFAIHRLELRSGWRPAPPVSAAPPGPRSASRAARLELAVGPEPSSGAARRMLREASQALGAISAVVAFGLLWSLVAEGPWVAHTPPSDRSISNTDEGFPVPQPPNEVTRAGSADASEEPATPVAEAGLTWLIDGFNLLHAGLILGDERQGEWWKEALRERVVEAVARIAPSLHAREVWVVFDGPHGLAGTDDPQETVESRPIDAEACPPLQITFARCADDWILAHVRDAEAPQRLAAVTADRRLANRLRHRGALVVEPRVFLAAAAPLNA